MSSISKFLFKFYLVLKLGYKYPYHERKKWVRSYEKKSSPEVLGYVCWKHWQRYSKPMTFGGKLRDPLTFGRVSNSSRGILGFLKLVLKILEDFLLTFPARIKYIPRLLFSYLSLYVAAKWKTNASVYGSNFISQTSNKYGHASMVRT